MASCFPPCFETNKQQNKHRAQKSYSQNTLRIPLINYLGMIFLMALIGNGLNYWNQNSIFKLKIEMLQR